MNNIIKRKWNRNSMVIIEDLQGMAFQAESGGHTFQISGIDGEGNAVALSGTPAGVMLRSDGQDVTLTCSVSGGVVSATLPANAYSVPGRFGLTIFLTSDGQKTAIYAAVGTVGKTSSGTVAPPAGSDVVTLVNQINTAIAAIPANYNACFAPAYSTSGLYSVGQYVTYNGNLYRCNTAITTAETWTAAHWTQTNLGADVYDLKSAIEREEYIANELAMEYNAPYSSDDFDIKVSGLTVSVTDKQIVMTNSGAADGYYSAMLSKRDYLNFDTSGYFILACKKPSWGEKYYALAVLPASGGLRSLVIDGSTIRTYSESLNIGTDATKMIRAYKEGDNLIVNLQGQKNVVDLSDYPIIPTDTTKGYWSIDDFAFGIAMAGKSKTIDYTSENLLAFGGTITSSYLTWGNLEANKYYAVPYGNSNLPALFGQYGVDRGILEVFNGHINTAKLMRFTSGSANAQFEAFYDNGTLSRWRLSYAEDRKTNSVPDYSALRYMGAITDSMDKAQRVGTYNVTTSATLPSEFTDLGIVSGMLIVVNGFADSNLWVLQIFISNNREYMFTRYGEVNTGAETFTSTSVWRLLSQPDSIKKGFAGTVYYALGDSITAGSFSKDDGTAEAATNAAWAYCRKIANMIGGTLHNIAVPGATSASVLLDQVSLVDDDATLITIMCGTGDYRDNLTLGTYTDTTAGTTCGNLYQIISQLMETAPNARIIVLSPPLAGNKNNPGETRRETDNTAGWNYDDLLVQYSALCKKYGIEFVDVLDNSPINRFNLLTMCKDGTHPTKESYTPLAQYIFGQIF